MRASLAVAPERWEYKQDQMRKMYVLELSVGEREMAKYER